MCTNSSLLRTILYLKYLLKIIMILAPILLIVTLMIKLFKSMTNSEVDFNTLLKESGTKILALIIIFALTAIISTVLSFIGESTEGAFFKCLNNANEENIYYYSVKEKVEKLIDETQRVPLQKNLDKLKVAIEEASDVLDDESMMTYRFRYAELEVLVNSTKLKIDCINKNGTFENGACNNRELFTASPSAMANYNDYYIVDTKVSVTEYQKNYIIGKKIYQCKGNGYADKCLGFAFIYAYSLYTGNTSARAKDSVSNWYHGNDFQPYTSDDKNVVLNKVYEQLVQNRPVVLHVQGKSSSSRHYVTVVGLKKTVKSASQLKEEDLLIIDTCGGEFKPVGKSTRYMTTGKQVGWGHQYTGYQIYYLK